MEIHTKEEKLAAGQYTTKKGGTTVNVTVNIVDYSWCNAINNLKGPGNNFCNLVCLQNCGLYCSVLKLF